MVLKYSTDVCIQCTDATAVKVEGLTLRYPGAETDSLSNVSLTAGRGTRVALVGANGSGKSTLLKAIAGLLKPVSGTVSVYGKPAGTCHHQVVYLPQRGQLDWRFPVTVERLVLTGRYVHLGWLKRPTAKDKEIAQGAMAQLKIDHLAGRQISELSGGQQQRALLARTLAQQAHLLLLDEPLNAVDAETRGIVAQVLDTLASEGKTALVATHDVGRMDTEYDAAIYLADGKQVQAPPGGATHRHSCGHVH